MNKKEKMFKYLNGYNLGILFTDDDECPNNSDIKEAQTIEVILDKAFPELIQKLNNLYLQHDIYNCEEDDVISDIGTYKPKDKVCITYEKITKCRSIWEKIQKTFPEKDFKVNYTKFDKSVCINIRIDTRDEYVVLLSTLMNLIFELD